MIMLEEETVRRIGVVLSGTVHMIKEDIDGGKSLMVTIRPGELFGESFACASQLSARVSFVAAAPCAVLFLPFHKVIHSCTLACTFHHRLIENMLRLLSEKNQRLMDKVAIIPSARCAINPRLSAHGSRLPAKPTLHDLSGA